MGGLGGAVKDESSTFVGCSLNENDKKTVGTVLVYSPILGECI